MSFFLLLLKHRGKWDVSKTMWLVFVLILTAILIYPAFASCFILSNIVFFFLFVPITLGLCLLWGYCGILSFGQVAFFGIAGYVYAIVTINFGNASLVTVLGLLSGLVATGLVAALFGYFFFYSQVSNWIVPILTLALTLILELFLGQTAGYEWRVGRALLGGFNGINDIVSLKLGSIEFSSGTKSLYYLVVFGSILLFLLIRMLGNSRWGDIIIAIREDIERTRMLGHNVNLIQVVVFVISALLAGLSGMMYVWWGNFIDPSSMGLISAVMPVLYTVVGGKESLLAVMISTITLGYIGDFLAVYGGQYAFLVNGVILLTVMMFYPRGILLTIGEQFTRFFARRTPTTRIHRISAPLETQPGIPAPSDVSAREDIPVSGAAIKEVRPVMLEVINVSKTFGGIKAVMDLSLAVQEGELRCLIGPNGAGKSTLFNLITGRYSSDAGSIVFQGNEISHLPPYQRVRRGISMKFQTTRIYETLTLAQNLDIAYRHNGSSGEENLDDRYWALSMFGIEASVDELAGSLMHAQKQWLEICLALATRPRLLLLDEPSVGMTPEETWQTAELVKKLTKSGLTILVVEHDMEFIRHVADLVTVLHQGRVFAEGSLSWIEANEEVRKIYLGEQ